MDRFAVYVGPGGVDELLSDLVVYETFEAALEHAIQRLHIVADEVPATAPEVDHLVQLLAFAKGEFVDYLEVDGSVWSVKVGPAPQVEGR